MPGLRKLIGRFRANPGTDPANPLTITGMVDGMGAAGFRRGEADWVGCFTFAVWRAGDGPVRTEPLRIERIVGRRGALDQFMDEIGQRRLIRVTIAAPPEVHCDMDRPAAEMCLFVGPAEDAEVAEAAAPILDPPPYRHASLGEFLPDERMPDSLEGHARWLGRRIGLTLVTDGNPPDVLAESALALLADQLGWQEQVDRAVYDALHPVWSENDWRATGDDPTREQWLARLTLKSVAIYEGGDFEFYFDDGGLFWGHCVLASGSLDEGITDAQMAG